MSQMPPPSPPGQPVPPGPPDSQGYMPSGYQEAPGATAGLVLGICSIVFSFPVIGLILAWVGFVKSRDAKALCEMNPTVYRNQGVALAGYICSIIGLCLGVLSLLSLCCVCGYLVVMAAVIGGAAGV